MRLERPGKGGRREREGKGGGGEEEGREGGREEGGGGKGRGRGGDGGGRRGEGGEGKEGRVERGRSGGELMITYVPAVAEIVSSPDTKTTSSTVSSCRLPVSPLIMLIGTFTPVSSDPENGSGREERAKMGTTKRKWTSDGRVNKSQGQPVVGIS